MLKRVVVAGWESLVSLVWYGFDFSNKLNGGASDNVRPVVGPLADERRARAKSGILRRKASPAITILNSFIQ